MPHEELLVTVNVCVLLRARLRVCRGCGTRSCWRTCRASRAHSPPQHTTPRPARARAARARRAVGEDSRRRLIPDCDGDGGGIFQWSYAPHTRTVP